MAAERKHYDNKYAIMIFFHLGNNNNFYVGKRKEVIRNLMSLNIFLYYSNEIQQFI